MIVVTFQNGTYVNTNDVGNLASFQERSLAEQLVALRTQVTVTDPPQFAVCTVDEEMAISHALRVLTNNVGHKTCPGHVTLRPLETTVLETIAKATGWEVVEISVDQGNAETVLVSLAFRPLP